MRVVLDVVFFDLVHVEAVHFHALGRTGVLHGVVVVIHHYVLEALVANVHQRLVALHTDPLGLGLRSLVIV